MAKKRLDLLCIEKGVSSSREQAKREILAGWVVVNGETARQPSKTYDMDAVIAVARPRGAYVSRGGYKLQKALDVFNLSLENRICADMGASTGGFTHCMLEYGAKKVYAVDVGYGQFDYGLRNHGRVVLYERTNVKELTADHFHDRVDFCAVDLSFISLLKIVPTLSRLFGPIPAVFLVKPQFEALAGEQKKGVVRKPHFHEAILLRTVAGLEMVECRPEQLSYSPVTGPKGNIEFLLLCTLAAPGNGLSSGTVVSTVKRAHGELLAGEM